jgi:hypothetical protein
LSPFSSGETFHMAELPCVKLHFHHGYCRTPRALLVKWPSDSHHIGMKVYKTYFKDYLRHGVRFAH